MLGAGATAASTLAALAQLGCTAPSVLVRSLGRTGTLQRAAHRMGVEPRFEVLDPASPALVDRLVRTDAVVATLPSRAADPVAGALSQAAVTPGGVLLDVVYDPGPPRCPSPGPRAAAPSSAASACSCTRRPSRCGS